LSPEKRRRYPRIRTKFPVEYSLGDKAIRQQTTTLGGGGLFLGEVEDLKTGSVLTIRFRPAKHLPLIEAKARVCYSLPGEGTALEFTEIPPEHREVLLRLIHHKTGSRRRHPRAALATQIQCQECMSLAFSRDVSVGGMFIETTDPMPVGSRLNLRFNIDDGPVVVAQAEVTYEVAKLGIGVQFVDLTPEDLKRIEAYVARSETLPGPASPEAAPLH